MLYVRRVRLSCYLHTRLFMFIHLVVVVVVQLFIVFMHSVCIFS